MGRACVTNTAVAAVISIGILLVGSGRSAQGQPQPADLNPHFGPHLADLGEVAQIQVPPGFLFLDATDTRTLMRQMGNTTSGKELGTVAKKDQNWFIVFEFDAVGYVKDTDKDNLNTEAILESIRASNEQANAYRQERGMRTMQIVGWQQPPTYNPLTKNLEWCVRATSEGQPLVNHNTRVLGRSGVMQVVLVVDPGQLDSVSYEAARVMQGFSFVSGQQYGQWRVGDKIADYGLTALVAGGAISMAMKTGLLQKLLKPIILALTVVGGVSARFVRRLRPSRRSAA